MFSSRSISTLCVTALPAFVLFKSVIALPLDPEWDALLSKVAEYNHAKGLQARAPCGDNCQSSSILPQWTTTTTATAWVPAPTSHRSSTRTCTPNFQGAAVKVSPANKDSSWCIPAAPGQLPRPNAKLESLVGSGTTFHIEQTGRAEMDFIIKLGGIRNNSLILAPIGDHIGLCDIGSAAHSSFKITCNSCFYGDIRTGKEELASGCTIMSCSSGEYMTEADGTICMQRGWTSSSSSSSSLSSSSAIQLFDIIASDETRRVVGDGRCDNDECYEQHGENSQRHKSESEGHCDGCEEDKVKVTVDDYSCAGDPQCLKK